MTKPSPVGSTSSDGRKLPAALPLWQSSWLKCGVHETLVCHTIITVIVIMINIIIIIMMIRYQYDTDASGFIEADELKVRQIFTSLWSLSLWSLSSWSSRWSSSSSSSLSEFFAGPAKGGVKVPRGDGGQVDWVHWHYGEKMIVILKVILMMMAIIMIIMLTLIKRCQSPQLQVFDSNKDGKLQLSEMAK